MYPSLLLWNFFPVLKKKCLFFKYLRLWKSEITKPQFTRNVPLKKEEKLKKKKKKKKKNKKKKKKKSPLLGTNFGLLGKGTFY